MTVTSPIRSTKVRLVAAALSLALVAVACGSSSDTSSLSDGDTGTVDVSDAGAQAIGEVIRFTFDDFEGNEISFEELADGGPVVVNFFASWCATCVAELPDFQTVSENFEGQVEFLGLSFQDRLEDSVALIEQTGVTFRTGRDTNGAIFSRFGGLGMPTTVFINAEGEVVNVHSGVLTAQSLTEAIESDLLP